MLKRCARTLAVAVATFGAAGCAKAVVPLPLITLAALAGVEKSSPAQKALGARANVRVASSDAGALYGVAGVQRQWFDGGHDNVFTAGLQGRRVVGSAGAWVGAEGTYNNWRVSDGFQDPVANVIGFSGLGGLPIGDGNVTVWGSAGLLFFSDFKRDGSVVYEGGTGWQLNVGVELGLGGRD